MKTLVRANARLNWVYGLEVHFVQGIVRMRSRVSLTFGVMMAKVLASIEAGQEVRRRCWARSLGSLLLLEVSD